ncbi:MAG: hypothetical protein EBQ92_14350 [Proteobacteria bacterium]|nr:hypothetical protein [Pseudomonadota bacterium]
MKITRVSKCLDKRLQLFGFEVMDIIAIFLTLSVLNFLFGETGMKLLFVWAPTLVLAGFLRFGKKGKPENYLLHLIRFSIRPRKLSAFFNPTRSLSVSALEGYKL